MTNGKTLSFYIRQTTKQVNELILTSDRKRKKSYTQSQIVLYI